MPYTRKVLAQWIAESHKLPGALLFTRLRGNPDQAITTGQYRRLVKKWVGYARLDASGYSAHSPRRTKPTLIYEQTKNVEAVREFLGHSTIASTSAYLGVDQRQAIEIAKQILI